MPSSTSPRPESSWMNLGPDLLLSLATGPLLLTVLGAKAMTQLMQNLGQASEEVFRGDRLPILDLSMTQIPPSDRPESLS